MNKLKNKISLVLSLLTVLFSLSPSLASAAEAPAAPSDLLKGPSVIGGNLGDWVLDEDDGYICAFSYDNDKLLFINTDDLKLKKEITLPGISDIELADGKLYAALDSYRQIAVIDIKTASVERKIAVKEAPYRIAVEGDKLFYILRHWSGEQQPDFTKLHILNLADSSETEIRPDPDTAVQKGLTGSYYLSGLTADRKNHILYIANTNEYSSGIFSINTKDNKTLSTNDGERFKGLYSSIILQGSDIFFGKYRLDAGDLSKVYGSYDGGVVYVSGDHVFAAGGIFDRDKFIKTGELPKDGAYSRCLTDSKGNIYLYEGQSYSVIKGLLSRFLFEAPGNGGSMDYNADTAAADDVIDRLSISKWLVDGERRMIYALSRENNALMFIGLDDLQLKNRIPVGKDPADLVLSDGKLYVALSSINQVAVVDIGTQTLKQNLVLKHMPAALAVDGSKLFYTGYEEKPANGGSTRDKFTRLYAYDLGSNSEKLITAGTPTNVISYYGESNMVLDASRHLLYIGAEMGAYFCAINTTDCSVKGISNSFVVNKERGVVAKAGDNVYYGSYKYAPGKLDAVYGYFGEPVVYAAGDLAFSKKAVYDAGSFEKIADLPFESDCLYSDSAENVYVYNKELRVIKKYSLKPQIEGFDKAYPALLEGTDYSVKNADTFNTGRKEPIQKIIVDDRRGLIYAISPSGYKLVVIGKEDLKVKKELIAGLQPKDMKLYGGKLYVASAGTNYVTVVDTASLTVERKIYLSANPELIAVDGDKLFYRDMFKMHVYDMSAQTERDMAFHDFEYGWDINYVEDLFVDGDNHILYGVRGSAAVEENFAAVSTLDLKPLKLPAAVGKRGTVSLNGMPVFDGSDLFSGQTRYDRDDLSIISQGLKGRILYVDDRVIITSYSAYLRSNNARLGDLPEYMDNLYVDAGGNAYSVDRVYWTIKKTSVSEILSSLVNKTAEGESFSSTGYMAPREEGKEETDLRPVDSVTFSDISSHWAKSDIEYLAARQIVKGKGISGAFSPDDRVTRAEFVAMLVGSLEINGGGIRNTSFTDVATGKWYYSPVMTASSLGLISGYGNGRFAPDATITREEIAALSVRALKYMDALSSDADDGALSGFADRDSISSWARNNAAEAVKAGIIKGMPGGMFAPDSLTTRAESAAIMKRLIDCKQEAA